MPMLLPSQQKLTLSLACRHSTLALILAGLPVVGSPLRYYYVLITIAFASLCVVTSAHVTVNASNHHVRCPMAQMFYPCVQSQGYLTTLYRVR